VQVYSSANDVVIAPEGLGEGIRLGTDAETRLYARPLGLMFVATRRRHAAAIKWRKWRCTYGRTGCIANAQPSSGR